MKKSIFIIIVILVFMQSVNATNIGRPIDGGSIGVEDFEPLIWLDPVSRIVIEDITEEGRYTESGEKLIDRVENYLFEGELLSKYVLTMDKNQKIKDVSVVIKQEDDPKWGIEVNCGKETMRNCILPNMRIEEELIDEWDPILMEWHLCEFTVEPGETMTGQPNMQGEYWIVPQVCDLTSLGSGLGDQCVEGREKEYWFVNPIISLNVKGEIDFNARPGTTIYSDTILVENGAEIGSGVMLDMFISGTDFYDSSSSGAMCPISNVLLLNNFDYYATNGAYSTRTDPRADIEGFIPITYGDNIRASEEIICNVQFNLTRDIDAGSLTTINNELFDFGAGAVITVEIDGATITTPPLVGLQTATAVAAALNTADPLFPDIATPNGDGTITITSPTIGDGSYVEIIAPGPLIFPIDRDDGLFLIHGCLYGDLGYSVGNVLSPGSAIAITFRLNMPEPCNGNFDSGSIYFWGEAI